MRLITTNICKSISAALAIASLPLLLSHCATKHEIPFPIAPQHPNMASVNTSQVNGVVLTGHMRLRMRTEYNNQHLTFRMPKSLAANASIYIKHHTLYINNKNNSSIPETYTLTIGKQLRHLSLTGNVSVDGSHLDTNALTINDASGGTVDLHGQVDVQRIYASQHAHLNIGWVNSPVVVLYANDHAHVSLAGTTKEAFIHLTGDANLHAAYLRAGSVTIDATENSIASLFPINSFQGFAHEASTVYLYHNPHYKNMHTWDVANIFMKSYRP